MKVSQITMEDICQQIRADPDYLTSEDKNYLNQLKTAAVEYAKSYTGLSEERLDEHEDITIAVLVLISDMYDNRQMYVDKSNENRVISTILGMYCENLL
jgi:hypothetical protein